MAACHLRSGKNNQTSQNSLFCGAFFPAGSDTACCISGSAFTPPYWRSNPTASSVSSPAPRGLWRTRTCIFSMYEEGMYPVSPELQRDPSHQCLLLLSRMRKLSPAAKYSELGSVDRKGYRERYMIPYSSVNERQKSCTGEKLSPSGNVCCAVGGLKGLKRHVCRGSLKSIYNGGVTWPINTNTRHQRALCSKRPPGTLIKIRATLQNIPDILLQKSLISGIRGDLIIHIIFALSFFSLSTV